MTQKTPLQELIDEIKSVRRMCDDSYMEMDIFHTLDVLTARAESLLEKEKEFVSNFATDYVTSGNIGCAVWCDGAPELDIDKSARDYYIETFNSEER